ENPDCPKGEWYCQNSERVVRHVTIFCKLQGEDLPTSTVSVTSVVQTVDCGETKKGGSTIGNAAIAYRLGGLNNGRNRHSRSSHCWPVPNSQHWRSQLPPCPHVFSRVARSTDG